MDARNTNSNLKGTADLASLDYNIFQSTYGLEYALSKKWAVGAVIGYGQSNLYNYQYSNAKLHADTYSGAIYALYNPTPEWKIIGLGGFTSFDNSSNRPIQFGTIDRTATANWSSMGSTFALTGEYDWLLNKSKPPAKAGARDTNRTDWHLKPRALISYSNYNQGIITESGANSLNLQVNNHQADSMILGIGITLETPIILSEKSRIIPKFSIGYQYDAMGNSNEEHQLTASFKDVPEPGSLTVIGKNRGANDLEAALKVELEANQNTSIYADVGVAFWSNGNELSYGGGIRYRW